VGWDKQGIEKSPPGCYSDSCSLKNNEQEGGLPIQYSKYCPEFRLRRKQELAKANNMCMRCGRRNRSFAFNSEGEIYMLYLHVAHVFPGEKHNPTANLIVLCPECHYYYDHPRKEGKNGVSDWEFIGLVARLCIEQDSRTTG
jgi:hypothetical protein